MNAPDPKANTTTEAYLAYKAGYLEESELKPKLYEPYLHFDAWLAYWAGLTNEYPLDKNGDPEMLTDEEALVAYLSGVTDTYPEEIKDPYDVRIVGYLRHLASIRWPEPDYPVNNEEFYLSTMEPTHTSNSEPSADIELDTAEGKIISVEAYGDTFQQTYSGKNLIDNTDLAYDYTNANTGDITLTSTTTGISMTYTGGGSAPFVLFVLQDLTGYEGKTIRMSSTFNGDLIRIYTSNADGTSRNAEVYTSTSGEVISWTVPNDLGDNHYLAYGLRGGPAGTYTFDDLIMTIDNADMSYEPYTGGVPAPNPDYPQDINVVTGEQTIKTTGKNICSECKTGNSNKLLYFRLPHLSYDKIVLSATLSVPLIGNTYGLELDGTFTQLGTWSTSADNKLERVFSLTDAQVQAINNSTNAWIRTYKSAGGFEIPSDAMIEYGTTASAYEPYQSQSYTINLGSTELCKIGDYQDYIYKNGDDWYVHKETNKAVYDGTETWYQWSYSSAFITVLDAINPSTRTTGIVMSDRFIEGASTTQGSQWNDFPNGTIAIRQFTNEPKIGFKTDVATDLATWKTWLSTHNTTVYYVLATPTDTQITDSTLIGQLDALAGADTYDEKTYIRVTATDPNLPALLKVEAYKY